MFGVLAPLERSRCHASGCGNRRVEHESQPFNFRWRIWRMSVRVVLQDRPFSLPAEVFGFAIQAYSGCHAAAWVSRIVGGLRVSCVLKAEGGRALVADL